MSLRAEHRRNGREGDRRCLTVSDAFRINWMRRLPTDHPSRGLRKRKNRPWRPRMAFPIYSEPAQAWRYLRVVRASTSAQEVSKWLNTHPGPRARCTPEVILLAMFLAAEIRGRYLRSDLCAVINGLDATILYHLGLCDNKTFEPVAYSEVEEQGPAPGAGTVRPSVPWTRATHPRRRRRRRRGERSHGRADPLQLGDAASEHPQAGH